MEQMAERIKQAQEDINRRRARAGIPPAADFVTFEYRNGFVTVLAQVYDRLPKYKKNKLSKGRR